MSEGAIYSVAYAGIFGGLITVLVVGITSNNTAMTIGGGIATGVVVLALSIWGIFARTMVGTIRRRTNLAKFLNENSGALAAAAAAEAARTAANAAKAAAATKAAAAREAARADWDSQHRKVDFTHIREWSRRAKRSRKHRKNN